MIALLMMIGSATEAEFGKPPALYVSLTVSFAQAVARKSIQRLPGCHFYSAL